MEIHVDDRALVWFGRYAVLGLHGRGRALNGAWCHFWGVRRRGAWGGFQHGLLFVVGSCVDDHSFLWLICFFENYLPVVVFFCFPLGE